MPSTTVKFSTRGNGLALRFTKPMATAAGVADGTPVRVSVEPGRTVIETQLEPKLEDMLAAFDPKRHGGEVMSFAPVGVEVL